MDGYQHSQRVMEWRNILTGHANGSKVGRKNHNTLQERLRTQNDLGRFAEWSEKEYREGV